MAKKQKRRRKANGPTVGRRFMAYAHKTANGLGIPVRGLAFLILYEQVRDDAVVMTREMVLEGGPDQADAGERTVADHIADEEDACRDEALEFVAAHHEELRGAGEGFDPGWNKPIVDRAEYTAYVRKVLRGEKRRG